MAKTKKGKRSTRRAKRNGRQRCSKARPRKTGSKARPRKTEKVVGSHPPHPRCTCERALYKRMDPGSVSKADPWAFCRNKACPLFGKNQARSA